MQPVELPSPMPAQPAGPAAADLSPPSATHLQAVADRLSDGLRTIADTLEVSFRNANLLKLLGIPLDAPPQPTTLPDLIRSNPALGAHLGMSTITEGVETADQLTRIRAESFTSVQGYLFSRPITADGTGALIASSPCPTKRPMA